MLLQQEPLPGYWYTNIVGQLIQVRALMYAGKRVTCVAVEYANGKREFVDMRGWCYLDLSLHSPRLERRGRVQDL
jgi:hypothetical protein